MGIFKRNSSAITMPDADALSQLTEGQKTELAAFIKSKPRWYHGWQITEDIRLPGGVDVQERCNIYGIPKSLAGARVLDIGSQSGGFSLEFERRGAQVTSIDTCEPDLYGFATLRRILNSKIDFRQLNVYDIDQTFPEGHFDYVLFSGVFYHLRHPLLVVDKIRFVVKDTVWVESFVIDNAFVVNGKRTKLDSKMRNSSIMQFYRKDELSEDPTNWFGPTVKCLEDILWSSGFETQFKGFDRSGHRGHFTAKKMEGAPEYERIVTNAKMIKEYGVRHYIG